MMNEHSFKRIQSLRTKQELIKVAPNDYKGIINLNYLNSTKKQSNVISKVKLWNQLFESGQLSEKWDKEFISQWIENNAFSYYTFIFFQDLLFLLYNTLRERNLF